MPTFAYEGIDDKGEDVSSICVAENKDLAIQQVRATGVFVYKIRETQIPTEIVTLLERQEKFAQIQERGQKRFSLSKLFLVLAGINCVACLGATALRIPLVPILTIPISLGLVAWSVSCLRGSIRDREEFRKILQEGKL